MSKFYFSRYLKRPAWAMALVVGVGLLLAWATAVLAGERKKTGDGESVGTRDAKPPVAAKRDEAGPEDDFGPPPGPPRDNGQRGQRPRYPQGKFDGMDERQPGPPRGDDGPPRQPGARPGPDNPPRGPAPGQPFGPPPRPPRQDWNLMEKSDPEMYKLAKAENDLDRRTHEVAQEYRETTKDQRAKLREDLKKLVTEQFQVRQQRRKLELTRFEEELKRLRDAADRREKNSQQIIDKRVSELLHEDSEVGF
jgi:hypothetical protein